MSQSYHVKFINIGFVLKKYLSDKLFFGNVISRIVYIRFISWSFAPEVSKAQIVSKSRDWSV